MESIRIRPAEEKDIPVIMKLLKQVCNVHNAIRPDLFIKDAHKYTAEELKVILRDESRPILAAVDENDVMAGYAFCIFKIFGGGASHTVKTLYIDDLCVDEDKRGRHIGKALFIAAKELAKSEKCYNVTLNVWHGNDSAEEFYKAMDMKPLKTEMEIIL